MMQKSGGIRRILAASLLLALTACGFHLRGIGSLPFESLYVQDSGAPGIGRDLKRLLRSSGIKLAANPEEAQASLELMSEADEKRILSLSGKGQVREYELLYHVVFRLRDAGSELWGEPQTVELRRDFSYSDSALLAKDAEQARLVNDMHSEAVREVLRRVSSLSKQKPAVE